MNSSTLIASIKRTAAASPFLWRWGRNFARAAHHVLDMPLTDSEAETVKVLRSEGIIECAAQNLFGQTGIQLLDRISREVDGLIEKQSGPEGIQGKQKSSLGKTYLVSLLSKEVDFESPFLQLAIQPSLLRIVNDYLGLRSYLRAINVWMNLPVVDPPKESQLWHRDGDDVRILKVFIYLMDVDMSAGPFWFIPGTHEGVGRQIPVSMEAGRVSDSEMEKRVPSSKWKACTGMARTVILADTTGFHKGGKCEVKPRVLLTYEYVSGASLYPREFHLHGWSNSVGLDSIQKDALFV
jgi:hypothetical protein